MNIALCLVDVKIECFLTNQPVLELICPFVSINALQLLHLDISKSRFHLSQVVWQKNKWFSSGSHLDSDANQGLLRDFSTLQDGTFKTLSPCSPSPSCMKENLAHWSYDYMWDLYTSEVGLQCTAQQSSGSPRASCLLLSMHTLMWVVPVHAQLSKWITFKAALPLPQLKMSRSDVVTSLNITPVFVNRQRKTRTKTQTEQQCTWEQG